MQSEKAFSKKVIPRLKQVPNSFWFVPPTRSRRGIPDIIGCVGGQFVAIELKRSGARPDKKRETLQEWVCNAIKDAGGLAFFRATPETIDQIIEHLIMLGEEKCQKVLKKPKKPS